MKLLDCLKEWEKEDVFESYSRVIYDFKDYEKITKKKMVEAMIKQYQDSQVVLDICTTRELKLLEMIVKGQEEFDFVKFEWEILALKRKFLIYIDSDEKLVIPEEIALTVKKALEKVNWKEKKQKDQMNEILVGICKIYGSLMMNILIGIASQILNKKEEDIYQHIISDRVFLFYVDLIVKNNSPIEKMPFAIYNDYCPMLDELEEQRKKYGKAGCSTIDVKEYQSLFYHDFNLTNPIIRKFYNRLNEVSFLSFLLVDWIIEYSLLNLDRDNLKKEVEVFTGLEGKELEDFWELMNQAMDEMRSGALNGFTPNEVKEMEKKEQIQQREREKNYVPQKNACLTEKEADLFYKIYFGLLDFTNQKFKIKPGYKIYGKKQRNPENLTEIIEQFWERKDEIIIEFCFSNPYKFNQEEIKIVQDFKKGIRDIFVVAHYEEEYTGILSRDKVYMIKGVRENIDRIISYKNLPSMVHTTILPFCGKLIYDGILLKSDMNFGPSFYEMVQEDYQNNIKNYHF